MDTIRDIGNGRSCRVRIPTIITRCIYIDSKMLDKVVRSRWSCKMRKTSGHIGNMQEENRIGDEESRMSDGGRDRRRTRGKTRRRKRKTV